MKQIVRYFIVTILVFSSSFSFAFGSDEVNFEQPTVTDLKCSTSKNLFNICVGEYVTLPEWDNARAIVQKIDWGRPGVSDPSTFTLTFETGRYTGRTIDGWKSDNLVPEMGRFNFRSTFNRLPNPTQVSWGSKVQINVDKRCGQIGQSWKGIVCGICAKQIDTLDHRVVNLRSVILDSNWFLSDNGRQMIFKIVDDEALDSIQCQSSQRIYSIPDMRVQDNLFKILEKAGGIAIPKINTKEI